MPLILLTGYPSSGKTHRAHQLLTYLQTRISDSPIPSVSRLQVIHINDQTLDILRSAYREARTEKEARGAFYSAVKRALGRDTIVVADGLNYIKGYRYQLYCEAKGLSTTNCVVHVGTPIPQCRDINSRLLQDLEAEGGYETEVFENLVYRYEEPNGMTRWDRPLFTVPFDDAEPPFEAIWEAMIGSDGKAKVVKPNTATILQPATESDYLYELDKTTQEVVTSILEWQKDHPGEGGQDLAIGKETVELPTSAVSLPQLQRIRRQFTAMNRQTQVPKARIRSAFVEYLNGSFGGP